MLCEGFAAQSEVYREASGVVGQGLSTFSQTARGVVGPRVASFNVQGELQIVKSPSALAAILTNLGCGQGELRGGDLG